MKAIGYQQKHALGAAQTLTDIELPTPTAGAHDLLVQVSAISVNPVDTKIRSNASADDGSYKVLGWDAVGTVTAVGSDVSLFKVGDRVWYAGDLTRPGSNAEYQLVDERIAAKAPNTFSDAEAAALPLTALTAWELLFDRLQIGAENSTPQYLLIVGAAGGVGSIMVQLAKTLTDVTVIATAGREASKQWLTELGADHVIDHHQDFAPQLSALGIEGVQYVASLNNTDDHIERIVAALKPQGKLGLIDDPQVFDLKLLKRKSLSLHWEFMYTRSMFSTEDMQRQHDILTEMATLADNGKIRTTVTERFGSINAANILRAHELLESHQARGKIVLSGFED
ncbi:zinc-binding alcohol dehydrogenase family protein [Shewanella sp. C32]|uniref:Zinc-type alcohol dehydrogenase-like protein n=1 Tax=Shewanella electrica TaxID=515560 RepID=A0ABT2FHJ3_9GAMM|nr:zinc-binding alcohol dehydrogenase family protein [Shewanella electrica]MCH1923905.1 zinc-binding alcohol dehydrogenase family protein [Shewanella electrica]MCS4555808.1 zinc-binding alcohol dehydrogenase family protein [Shewanella electrica]